MDRLKMLAVSGFLAGNLALWQWGWPDQPAVPKAVLEERIRMVSADLRQAEATAAWKNKVRPALDHPPGMTVEATLRRIQAMAGGHGVTITETSSLGDRPVKLQFAGTGPYRGVASILTDLNREPAIVLERIGLSGQGPGRVIARVEASVRSGSWEGPPVPGKRDEPAPVHFAPSLIGMKDLFGAVVGTAAPSRPARPAVVYTGYFAETGSPTVLLVEQNQFLVLAVGEKTPGRSLVASATPERVTLQDERGETWTVDMQVSH